MEFTINYIKSMRLYYAFVTGIPGWLGVAYYESIAVKLNLPPVPLWKKGIVLVALFLSWGINQIVNDYLGIEEDRINAPQRPMVTGKLNPTKALKLTGFFLIVLSIITWKYLNPVALIPMFIGITLNVIYEYAKGKGVWGNIVFGFMILTTAYYGGLASGNLSKVTFTLNVIGVSILVVVVNGMMTFYTYFKDYRGDKKAGKRTLIVKHGLRKAKKLSLIGSIIPSLLFVILFKMQIITANISWIFIFLGILATFLFVWTGILFYLNPIGEKTYYSLETNFKACTCFQAAIIGLFNEKLALVLFISAYIFVEFLFSLHNNSKA